MTTSPAPGGIAHHYRSVRLRLTDLLLPRAAEVADVPVAACPGWRVRDVVAHLLGNLEDGAAGRLSGPPSPAQTAAQVERHRSESLAEVLTQWTRLAEVAETTFDAAGRWPVLIDATSHWLDVAGALGEVAGRDSDAVRAVARVLAPDAPDPATAGLRLVLDGEPRLLALGRSDGSGADPVPTLTCDSHTWLRLRMGRRSAAQARALAWDGAPASVDAVLAGLFVFGPRETDLVE